MVTMLCGKLKLLFLHVHFVPGGKVSYQFLWLPGSMVPWSPDQWYSELLLWLPGNVAHCCYGNSVVW